MSTATGLSRRRASLTAFTGARAVAAAALAALVTFSADHTAAFGLAVYGVFAVVQGGIVAAGAGVFAGSTTGRTLAVLRAALLVVVGVVALVLVGAGPGVLLTVEIVGFLGSGALEVAAGLRRSDATVASRDLVAVGVLELLVGALLAVLLPGALFAVGVLSAWGAVVAVYLGIAAVSIARREGEAR